MSGRRYTDAEIEFVYKHRKLNRKELAKIFNEEFAASVTDRKMYALCARRGWRCGRSGQFSNGHKLNANRDYKETPTSFKKGNLPHNTRPVGDKRTDKDGNEEIKIAHPNSWKRTSTILWERYMGPIPVGHVIAFKNGDNSDITIENMECISRRELFERNKLIRLCGDNVTTRNAIAKIMYISSKKNDKRQHS